MNLYSLKYKFVKGYKTKGAVQEKKLLLEKKCREDNSLEMQNCHADQQQSQSRQIIFEYESDQSGKKNKVQDVSEFEKVNISKSPENRKIKFTKQAKKDQQSIAQNTRLSHYLAKISLEDQGQNNAISQNLKIMKSPKIRKMFLQSPKFEPQYQNPQTTKAIHGEKSIQQNQKNTQYSPNTLYLNQQFNFDCNRSSRKNYQSVNHNKSYFTSDQELIDFSKRRER